MSGHDLYLLSWYFSQGGDWSGSAGLRSTLGAQLHVMETGIVYESEAIDGSQAENHVLDRLEDAAMARAVEYRLAQLDPRTVHILRTHYDCGRDGRALVELVDPCAIVLPQTRQLVVSQVFKLARAALANARRLKGKGKDLVACLVQVRRYRDQVRTIRRAPRLWPGEVREALLAATDAERDQLRDIATEAYDSALAAYLATTPRPKRRAA